MKATNINIDIWYIDEYFYKFTYRYFIDTDILNIDEIYIEFILIMRSCVNNTNISEEELTFFYYIKSHRSRMFM